MRWTINIVKLHEPLRRIESLIVIAASLEDALRELPAHLDAQGIDSRQPVTLRLLIDGEEETFSPPFKPTLVKPTR